MHTHAPFLLAPLVLSLSQVAIQAPWLVAAADADGDGRTTRAEWDAFSEGLPLEGQAFERGVVLARGLVPRLDGDGDGRIARADLEHVFATLDADGDGSATAAELQASSLTDQDRFLAEVALGAADANGDAAAGQDERSALLSGLGDPLSDADLARLLTLAMRGTTADRNAMSASVVLLGFEAALDADQDGRVTPADLAAHFASLDRDGNDIVEGAELLVGRFQAESFRIRTELAASGTRMPWQRGLADALALARHTQKPLLLCVNMDGETASDTLALDRYRDPEFVALARGFIPLIASPDRRNPFDHDDAGRRIPDPRFGRVTTSEAIDIEPLLYERYFSGRRVAPRHVGVSPAGEILFDIFLIQDLSLIDRALREHGMFETVLAPPAELSEPELLASPDAGHRDHLEARFAQGTETTRVRLASLALDRARTTQHPELLRMALRDASPSVRSAALASFAADPSSVPLELFSRAWIFARASAAERSVLLAAIARRASEESDDALRARAERQLAAFQGVSSRPRVLDPERWELTFALEPPAAPLALGAADFDETVALLEKVMPRLEDEPQDPARLLDAAAVQMRFALVTLAQGGNPTFAFEDALDYAQRALAAEPDEPRAEAWRAWALYQLGRGEDAASAAERALPGLARDAATPLAFRLLEVYARSRTQAIYARLGTAQALPAEWLPDLFATHSLLVAHPGSTQEHVIARLDLLGALELYGEQTDALRQALDHDPLSPVLHNYLRFVRLRDAGSSALEATYTELVHAAGEAEHASIVWFAGLASLVAAEHLVQTRNPDGARAAYERSAARFEESIEAQPAFADSAGHYVCLALAGLARLQADAGELERAAKTIARAIEAFPSAAETADGLGNTPAAAARAIAAQLDASGARAPLEELRATLEACGL